jgi:hypothetical protein
VITLAILQEYEHRCRPSEAHTSPFFWAEDPVHPTDAGYDILAAQVVRLREMTTASGRRRPRAVGDGDERRAEQGDPRGAWVKLAGNGRAAVRADMAGAA